MSDIDDILAGIDSAPGQSQGWDRYAPDFVGAQAEASNSAFDRLSQAGSNIWNQGAGPVNVGQAALAGLEYLASPFTAFGKAIGDPLGRAIGDFTGMPKVGQVIGDTAALAPAMMAPFPGARSMRTLGEGMGAMMGEGQAARSVADNIPAMFAGKAAARSDIDDALEEATSSGSRATSRAQDIEHEIAMKWYDDQFRGGSSTPEIKSMFSEQPSNIRLLEKGNPKVGERKYAQDEAGKPVNIEGFEPSSNIPTYRTGKAAAEPSREYPPVWDEGGYPMTNLGTQFVQGRGPTPTASYDNAFRRQFEPSNVALGSPPSQMPLRPEVAGALPENLGIDAERFREMYLPNIENRTPVDPNLLAELQLKFGGKQQGGGAEPPWTQNQNAGIRPIAAPFPGARQVHPWQSPSTPNVMFPAGETRVHPVPMGKEARQDTSRLREDLGVPADPEEVYRKELAKRPNLSAGPNAEAAPKVTKSDVDPLAAMQKRVDEVAPSTAPSASSDLPMTKTNVRTYDPKDIGSVIKAIKDSRPTTATPVYYSELMEKIPGVSKTMLDRAFSKVKEGNVAYRRGSDSEKGQFIDIDPRLQVKTVLPSGKTEVATRALNIATQNGKLKQVYLQSLRPHILQRKDKTIEVGESTMVRHLNNLIQNGQLKVYREGVPDKPMKKITAGILSEDNPKKPAFIAEFIKKPKDK